MLKPCMLKLFALALAVSPSAQAQPINSQVFFSQDWCPVRSELAELEVHFRVVRNGCCIYRVEPIDPNDPAAKATLLKFSKSIVIDADLGSCYGDNAEAQAERDQLAAEAVREAQASTANELAALPDRLRRMSIGDLCLFVGQSYRAHEAEGRNVNQSALPAIWRELKVRSITVDFVRSIRRQIVIGDDSCQLLASMGLPRHVNRTVTKSGERVQHVYSGRLFVYTENGKVTAYQD